MSAANLFDNPDRINASNWLRKELKQQRMARKILDWEIFFASRFSLILHTSPFSVPLLCTPFPLSVCPPLFMLPQMLEGREYFFFHSMMDGIFLRMHQISEMLVTYWLKKEQTDMRTEESENY